MPDILPQQPLTIFLIKDGITLDDIFEDIASLKNLSFVSNQEEYRFYVKEVFQRTPKWAFFFDGFVDLNEIGKTSSPGGVLLVEVEGKKYALTFGPGGRFLLNPSCYVHGFGLRIVLNSIRNVRSLDRRRFDSIASLARFQAVRETNIYAFGLDVERDLLKSLVGTSSDITLGTQMSGHHSLSVTVRTSIENLRELLPRYYEKFQDDSYKRSDFAFVDKIQPVTEKATNELLDQLLIDKLVANEFAESEVELALPEIIEYSEIEGFRYTKSNRRSPTLNEISIRTYLDEKTRHNNDVTIEGLHRERVYAVHANDEIVPLWPVYRCINAELVSGASIYVLSDGSWYLISRDFKEELDNFFATVPRYGVELPAYRDVDEGAYNKRVCNGNPQYVLYDRELVQVGNRQKFEFCDILTSDRDLIHVKRGQASSSLSHLFAQGLVSAEAFLLFDECRQTVNLRFPEAIRLADSVQRPSAADFQVVYGIINNKDELSIPFFSRVSLRHAYTQLTLFGYRCAVAHIKEDRDWERLLRYPEKRRAED